MTDSTYTTPSVVASFDASSILTTAHGTPVPGNGSQVIIYN